MVIYYFVDAQADACARMEWTFAPEWVMARTPAPGMLINKQPKSDNNPF